MRSASADPTARRLRNYLLLTVFAVVLPSLALTGFGLIAINNERDVALKRIHSLYKPVVSRLAARIEARLEKVRTEAAEPLTRLRALALREVSSPGPDFTAFNERYPEATSYFVFDRRAAGFILPRPETPLPTWQGYLPPALDEGRSEEFSVSRPARASRIYSRLLQQVSVNDPARCPLLNAMARSAAAAGAEDEALRNLEELIATCGDYVDHTGYNLALGAWLRWLELLTDADNARLTGEADRLAGVLSDPCLKASRPQVRFVAQKAAQILAAADGRRLNRQARRLKALAARDELLEAISIQVDSFEDGIVFRAIKIDEHRQLVLVRGGTMPCGFLLEPAAMTTSLEEELDKMQLGEGLQAHLVLSTAPDPEEQDTGVIAGSSFLRATELAWRLDLILSDAAAIDNLTETRTSIYLWVLILTVAALVLGIGKSAQVMIREARLSRLKTDFVSSVSHELRTPLTSIRMFTETLLLGRVRDRAEERDCLETIGKETERLSRLVERILDFSRMEAGRKAFKPEPVEVSELFGLALAACKPMIEERGFEVHESIPADMPPIRADKDAMVEVLINLLSNAIKYSPENRRVDLWARSEKDTIAFGATDRGVGISRLDQKKIFEKFYRVDMPLASEVPGSGLGLSLVHYIVQAHGGEIELESAPGRGSTFTVRLPRGEEGIAEVPGREE